MTDEDIISDIIRREGERFTNDPLDRGGPTKYGITMTALSEYRGHPCTPADVACLSEGEAREIYRVQYIRRPKFDKINDRRLRALVIDWGVNSHPRTSTKALQRAAGVKDDGALGPVSLAAINGGDASALFDAVLSAREAFYRSIVSRDPSQSRFLNGWLNRCAEFRALEVKHA